MNLLASTLLGGLYLLILFGLCFGSVVGIKYLRLRLSKTDSAPTAPRETPQETPKKEPESPKEIYYIVEKKRKRSSSSNYSSPKKIKFE